MGGNGGTELRLKAFVLPKVRLSSDYDNLDPLDGRYYDPDVARYLSEQSRITYQAYVEAALAHTLADFGLCSHDAANAIERSARLISVAGVYDEEKITKHDIKALVNCIKRGVPENAQPYVHFAATSYDIVSTAMALQMRDTVSDVIVPQLDKLLDTLISLSEKYADTTQIGRTHGQHAVPITFGFAVSEFVERLGSSKQVLEDLAGKLYGKFSGAVGAYNALSIFVDDPLVFETAVLSKVGLHPAPYSTQIVPPEGVVRLIDEMTVMAGVMSNLAHDMRHLQRSEIAEVRERFEPGQAGSSTMAHKRNPWNFENVISMGKQVIAQSVNSKLNLSSEHQRDLTDSASARFYPIVPACIVAMAKRLRIVMGKLEVDPEVMQRNLGLSGGAIAAEPLYLLLAKYGHPAAHEQSKKVSQYAIDHSVSLHAAVVKDKELSGYWKRFSDIEQRIIQEPETYYTGIASKKARMITRRWKHSLNKS